MVASATEFMDPILMHFGFCAVDMDTKRSHPKHNIPSISVRVWSMDDDDESILSVFIGPSQINGFSNTYVIQLNCVSE